jgi:hypothetical protein
MAQPKAYSPEQGYRYQILTRMTSEREWEHCDYAKDRTEKDYLLANYRSAYGSGFTFNVIELPQKYWKEA